MATQTLSSPRSAQNRAIAQTRGIEKWFKYAMADYLRPDEAVKLAGVRPQGVTDILISHAHWGGLADGWNHGGVDPEGGITLGT